MISAFADVSACGPAGNADAGAGSALERAPAGTGDGPIEDDPAVTGGAPALAGGESPADGGEGMAPDGMMQELRRTQAR